MMHPRVAALLLGAVPGLVAAEDFRIPALRLEPLPRNEVAFFAGESERTRWHFDPAYPRPFFFPFNGPSGSSLTRMGHPGAANHDHHRSIWFGHREVGGRDFWSEGTGNQVRQKEWLCLQDGDEECILAVRLGWFDRDGSELMEQELVAALRDLPGGEITLELQSTFRPAPGREEVQLGQTNFGFLAVRVAKTISEFFGGGILTNSRGQVHEPDLFGQPAEWMDYSGPVAPDGRIEGITYHDHPSNPRYPSKWHVREDGWMGASLCLEEGLTLTAAEPLRLRYLLHAHAGPIAPGAADALHGAFADRSALEVVKRTEKHGQWDVLRRPVPASPPAP